MAFLFCAGLQSRSRRVSGGGGAFKRMLETFSGDAR